MPNEIVNKRESASQHLEFRVMDGQLKRMWVYPTPEQTPKPDGLLTIVQNLPSGITEVNLREFKKHPQAEIERMITELDVPEEHKKILRKISHTLLDADEVREHEAEMQAKREKELRHFTESLPEQGDTIKLACGHKISRWGNHLTALIRLLRKNPQAEKLRCPICGVEFSVKLIVKYLPK